MNTVCVHGLGHIGLPTAAVLAQHGYQVYGYDSDVERREAIERHNIPTNEAGLQTVVSDGLREESLIISDQPIRADIHLICVPTPMQWETYTADLGYVKDAALAVADRLRSGDAVILESTVPPGTTVQQLLPLLETSGLTAGDEFDLAYSPETVLPGAIMHELRTNDRIVGGINTAASQTAVELYESFVTGEIRAVPDPTTAEFVKLIQNTFRDVNIALANELAKIAADYDIDARLGIDLANAHPRVNIHDPGPGVGGHCLPIDPWFLAENSDELDIISTARAVNDGMSRYVARQVDTALGGVDGRHIAILGIAYKGNVGDIRMSPGLALADALTSLETSLSVHAADGGNVNRVDLRYHDPHAVDAPVALVDLETAVTNADAIIITSDHDDYANLEPAWLASRMNDTVLVDTKAMLDRDRWEETGFTVLRI